MPTVLLWEGFRFYFFSNEGYEPPHIPLIRAETTAKFWLEPVALARNVGFPDRVLGILERKVVEERLHFLEAWNEYFRRNS